MVRSVCGTLLFVAAVSCLSPTGPEACGSFLGRTDGAASDSVSGCAIFTINVDNGAFGLLLTNGQPSDANPAIKILRDVGRPIPGTYQIVPCGSTTSLCGAAFLQDRRFDLSGSVEVTESDTLGVTGSLDAVGTDSDGFTLTIRGSFTALCKGQKKPFEVRGDPVAGAERNTPCKPSSGSG